jgi:hypothetical protein
MCEFCGEKEIVKSLDDYSKEELIGMVKKSLLASSKLQAELTSFLKAYRCQIGCLKPIEPLTISIEQLIDVVKDRLYCIGRPLDPIHDALYEYDTAFKREIADYWDKNRTIDVQEFLKNKK